MGFAGHGVGARKSADEKGGNPSNQSQTLGRIGRGVFQKGENESNQRVKVQKGLKNRYAGFRDVNCAQNIEYGTLSSTSDNKS